MSWIETLIAVLTAFGFGSGVSLVLIGSIFVYQTFIENRRFESKTIMGSIGLVCITIGLSFLWLVLGL